MDKRKVIQAIREHLGAKIALAVSAAEQARETATNKENVAENKYDTLGLEAAYLAHGQSNRVLELEAELQRFASLSGDPLDEVSAGALTCVDRGGVLNWYFIGPGAAGLSLTVNDHVITVVTPASPLGEVLAGQTDGDQVTFNGADLEIVSVC